MDSDKLTTFLYLLMRDHVPTGVVFAVIAEVNKDAQGVLLTNEELENMAARYARLLA